MFTVYSPVGSVLNFLESTLFPASSVIVIELVLRSSSVYRPAEPLPLVGVPPKRSPLRSSSSPTL